MSWFADLAGKAENLLTNLDEQTGAALRNHNAAKPKRSDIANNDNLLQKSQKRLPRSPIRRQTNFAEIRNTSPPRRIAPPPRSPLNNSKAIECLKDPPTKLKRSPTRKNNSKYDLNHCPKTMVGDNALKEEDEIILHDFNQRRYSLPEDINLYLNEKYSYKLQNLEVENSMLKNELNVMNKEVSDLLDRLRKTEDGNIVLINSPDLEKTQKSVESTDKLNNNLNHENNVLNSQIQQLKERVDELINLEILKFKENNHNLEKDVEKLKETNHELEEKLQLMESQNNATCAKLENDLRHAQCFVKDLQHDLDKSKSECNRLEKDWETYKLRVKSMLHSKDKELKALQDVNYSDDTITKETGVLVNQIESLKDERDELLETVAVARGECAEMKQYVEQLETRSQNTERLVIALREALREERLSKNKADSDCLLLKKELKRIQTETTQTISHLNTLIQEKDTEIITLKELSSTSMSPDSSALNVADYDARQESIANEKVQYLTQTLVVKQGKIDSLLADNNMLRIQLEKLNSKYKKDLSTVRTNHSVVNVNDSDGRTKIRSRYIPESVFERTSVMIGLFMRRNPIFRIIILLYMVGLHLWVALVLLTYTPEVHPDSRSKT